RTISTSLFCRGSSSATTDSRRGTSKKASRARQRPEVGTPSTSGRSRSRLASRSARIEFERHFIVRRRDANDQPGPLEIEILRRDTYSWAALTGVAAPTDVDADAVLALDQPLRLFSVRSEGNDVRKRPVFVERGARAPEGSAVRIFERDRPTGDRPAAFEHD